MGETTGSQTVVLSNPGDWELSYNTFAGEPWLRVTPPGGEVDGQSVTLTFAYDLESLKPGTYPTPGRIYLPCIKTHPHDSSTVWSPTIFLKKKRTVIARQKKDRIFHPKIRNLFSP